MMKKTISKLHSIPKHGGSRRFFVGFSPWPIVFISGCGVLEEGEIENTLANLIQPWISQLEMCHRYGPITSRSVPNIKGEL